ncbi:MAG: hypothetical protein WCL28_10285 [bacterium]
MKHLNQVFLAVGIVLLPLTTTSCGKWFGCLVGKDCKAQQEVENAATADLFVQVVNLSLDSFKGVMAELGLSDAQQNEVASDVQATAQQLTTQLGLTEGETYSGTMLENLSAMFEDLLQHAIDKIMAVAPSVDESKIMNACAMFMNDMIANAGLVGILESLPVDEQANIPLDQTTQKPDWEILRAPMERVASSSFSGKVEGTEVGAAFEKFKRRPGEQPPPPANVIGYVPTAAEKQSGNGRLQNLCEGHPGAMGRGQGRAVRPGAGEGLPIPHKGCESVQIDKKLAFCIFARPEAMKICPDISYGDDASAASKNSFKIWVDNSEDQFSDFESGRKYDCKVAADRDSLAKIVTKRIQLKKTGCTMTPPMPPRDRPGASNTGGPR